MTVFAVDVGTEVSSGGISGGGGPGLAMSRAGRRPHQSFEQLGAIGRVGVSVVSALSLEVARGPDHDQFLDPLVAMGH